MTAIVSFVVVALGTLMGMRLFFLGVPGGGIYPVPVAISLIGLAFTIGWFFSLRRSSLMSTPEYRNSRKRIISSEISHMRPLLFFVVVTLIYVVYATAIHQTETPNIRDTFVWGINYLMYCLPLLAGYTLGRANRRLDTSTITYFVAVLMGISLLFALGDYFHFAGFANPIGAFLYKWNVAMKAAGGPVFILIKGEPLRASGLETYPFRLALPAVIAAAWACSAKGTPVARFFIHFCVVGIILTSGARSAILAYVAVLSIAFSIWVMHYLTDRLGLTRAGGAIALVTASLVVVGVLGIGYALVPASQPDSTPSSSYKRVLDNIASFKYELAHNQLDSHDLDMLGSGRWVRWERSVKLISEHPLGSGRPYRELAEGSHAHNDILAALVWGGPLMLLALLLLYWWMAFRTRTPGSPYFGLFLTVGIAVAGLTESAVIAAPYLFFGLFLLGASRSDVDRSGEHHFSWDTIK